MKTEVTIRELAESDVSAASKLLHEMWIQHADATKLLDSDYIKKFDVESWCRKFIEDQKQKAWVAEVDGRVVALASMEVEENIPGMYGVKKMAYFDSLVVDKNFRRHGIADMLVETRLKYAKSLGIKVCYSKIYSFNKAPQALMEKHGFEDIYHYYYKFLN